MANISIFAFLMFLCSVQAKETCCPDGWIPYHGSCYLFHDDVKMSWNAAFHYCKSKTYNGSLAAVETANESLFLKYYARKLYKPTSSLRQTTAFWLGGSDSDIEGIWKWMDKDEIMDYKEGTFDNSPDNHEDCLALNGAYDFKWHDGVCNERVGYPLCEIRNSHSKHSLDPDETPSYSASHLDTSCLHRNVDDKATTCCRDALLPYKGSCYLFYDTQGLDWNESQVYCENKHSDLVAIESINEDRFLKAYVRRLYRSDGYLRNRTIFWTAGNDIDIEGVWKWAPRNEPVTYSGWAPSANTIPDNHQDCLALNGAYDFNWHDQMCRERIGSPLCESPWLFYAT